MLLFFYVTISHVRLGLLNSLGAPHVTLLSKDRLFGILVFEEWISKGVPSKHAFDFYMYFYFTNSARDAKRQPPKTAENRDANRATRLKLCVYI